jgi:hypothetical protein
MTGFENFGTISSNTLSQNIRPTRVRFQHWIKVVRTTVNKPHIPLLFVLHLKIMMTTLLSIS